MKDKTLSDKEIIENAMNCSTSKITCLRRVIVLMKDREKEFIQKLKDELSNPSLFEEERIIKIIDKLAGDALIHSQQGKRRLGEGGALSSRKHSPADTSDKRITKEERAIEEIGEMLARGSGNASCANCCYHKTGFHNCPIHDGSDKTDSVNSDHKPEDCAYCMEKKSYTDQKGVEK